MVFFFGSLFLLTKHFIGAVCELSEFTYKNIMAYNELQRL